MAILSELVPAPVSHGALHFPVYFPRLTQPSFVYAIFSGCFPSQSFHSHEWSSSLSSSSPMGDEGGTGACITGAGGVFLALDWSMSRLRTTFLPSILTSNE